MLNKNCPYILKTRLWVNRKKFGTIVDQSDSDWKKWLDKGYTDFYQNTQTQFLGNLLRRLSCPLFSEIDFSNKTVLEIGPGEIWHLKLMNTKPKKYVLCDVDENFLRISKQKLDKAGIENAAKILHRNMNNVLPFSDDSFDIILSFNCLEHLNPIDFHLVEMKRVLRMGGHIAGCIPCEGGIAWGIGRFLTTRNYVIKKYGINYDKIICWEHPNFADYINERLTKHFNKLYLKKKPFPFLPLDFNLVMNFIYYKSKTPQVA
jgi:SAM-dependent methyltransferase